MPRTPDPGAVVVTGASKGIGRACALRLDRRGFRVFAGVRRAADGDALRAEGSDRLTPIHLDVTDADAIAAAADAVAAAENAGLAGLINNAGIAIAGPLEFLPPDALRRQLEVNVVGLVAVTQAFLPLLRRGRGRIVNIGSIAGVSALPFVGAYAASKHAVEALTDALRIELLPWGMQVAVIEPGGIATPIWETSIETAERLARDYPPEAEAYYGTAMEAVRRAAEHAAQHGGSPDSVARAVEHALTAARPRTRYLVGADARLRAALRFLPDRLRDRLIAWRLGHGRTDR
ncbi:MAG TPA: SDR family oxidoreductase [Longimicrobiales bacterium]